MILKIFSPKNLAKKLFLLKLLLVFGKIVIITLVFEENENNVFAENRQKSQKIVIITSTLGRATFWAIFSQSHPCIHL
jgi:dipeptide/tripeptide permease